MSREFGVALTGVALTGVALGSALGSAARFLVSAGILGALGGAEAIGLGHLAGTLIVNVVGSALIGFYAARAWPNGGIGPDGFGPHFVMAGFCGGLTTFSIFSLEMLMLVEGGRYALAGGYLSASLMLWVPAAWAGHRLGSGG